MEGVGTEADDKGKQDEEDGAQGGRGVEQFCQSQRIITGDGIAAGSGHELTGVSLLGAGLGAFTAVVAQPEFLATEQLFFQTELCVADEASRESFAAGRERANRRAVAAVEAFLDIHDAVFFDLS